MKITKEECIELGISYVSTYNCYPAAKGWTIKTAGCSRDRVYENWNSWQDFVLELSCHINIPDNKCVTSSNHQQKLEKLCKNCNTLIVKQNTYCSNKCQHEFQNKQLIRDFLADKYVGKPVKTNKNSWLRLFLESELGNVCSECGITDSYNNKPLLLEIDHIDGRCYNNTLSNLRFLCPNCHSQTATYKAKNKHSDNQARYKNKL